MTLVGRGSHTEASLSPTSTDLLYLRIAQVPRSQDLAIFCGRRQQQHQQQQRLQRYDRLVVRWS